MLMTALLHLLVTGLSGGTGGKRRPSPVLFTAILGQIEGEDAFVIRRALEHFRMAQGANGIVIAGAPVLLHAGAREVVILRMALVVPGAVDQVHDVVNITIADRPEQLRLWA